MFRLATSCEMSRLNCFHNVAHHQTEKPVWTWFSGCGQLSECHRSIQRWNLFVANPSVLLLHQFQCVDEQDVEDFTPLHPDVLSAPEMAGWVQAGKKKMGEVNFSHFHWHFSARLYFWRLTNKQTRKFCTCCPRFAVLLYSPWLYLLLQVVHGQVVLRKERPAIFCLVSSVFCCLLAVIGMQVSSIIGCLQQAILPPWWGLLVELSKSHAPFSLALTSSFFSDKHSRVASYFCISGAHATCAIGDLNSHYFVE